MAEESTQLMNSIRCFSLLKPEACMQHCCSLFYSADSSSFLTPTAISCPSPKHAPNRTAIHSFLFNFKQHHQHSAGGNRTVATQKYLTGVRLEIRATGVDKAKFHLLKDFGSLLAVLKSCLGPIFMYLFPLVSYM